MIGVSVPLLLFVLVMTPMAVHIVIGPPPGALLGRCLLAAMWLFLIACSIRMTLSVRDRFVVGVDRISLRDWRRTRSLLFEDLAGCTVSLEEHVHSRSPTVRGTRLTFQSRHPNVASLSLFIDERAPIDAAIVQRLKALPMLPHRALRALEMASIARGQSN